jgi:hypothetical protein
MTNPVLYNPGLPALVMMESLDVSTKKEANYEVGTAVFCFSGLARGFALVRLFFDATNCFQHTRNNARVCVFVCARAARRAGVRAYVN